MAQPTELYVNIHTATNTTGEDRTMTPWDNTSATEVPCGPSTDPPPDAGASEGGGTPIPVPTATSTAPPASTSTAGTSGTSGLGAPTGDDTPPPAKKGCSASGSTANGVSMALLAGLGVFAATGRLRRRSKKR